MTPALKARVISADHSQSQTYRSSKSIPCPPQDRTRDGFVRRRWCSCCASTMGEIRCVLRRIFCPRITRIDANDGHGFARSAFGVPRRPRIAFRSHASFHQKRHDDLSHSQSFAKSSNESLCFVFAFIRVIRGLNFGCGGAAPCMRGRTFDSSQGSRFFVLKIM
jgi:hypothetical protein